MKKNLLKQDTSFRDKLIKTNRPRQHRKKSNFVQFSTNYFTLCLSLISARLLGLNNLSNDRFNFPRQINRVTSHRANNKSKKCKRGFKRSLRMLIRELQGLPLLPDSSNKRNAASTIHQAARQSAGNLERRSSWSFNNSALSNLIDYSFNMLLVL